MAFTHNYKIKLEEYNFNGEIEINNAGVLGYTEDGDVKMPKRIKDAIEKVFDLLSILPKTYSDLKQFKITSKEDKEE